MCTTTIVYYRYESYSIYVYCVYSFVRACMRNITKEKKSVWRFFFCWQVIASWWKVSSRLLHLLFVIRFFHFFTIHRCVYMRLFLWKYMKMLPVLLNLFLKWWKHQDLQGIKVFLIYSSFLFLVNNNKILDLTTPMRGLLIFFCLLAFKKATSFNPNIMLVFKNVSDFYICYYR